jgi:hypothetical protein
MVAEGQAVLQVYLQTRIDKTGQVKTGQERREGKRRRGRRR